MKLNVIVIGGGPAGMMAAGKAAERNSNVLLLEKKSKLGVKLLITGKGRCNLTNAEPDLKEFSKKFGKNGRFLLPALYNFGPKEMMKFMENRGVPIKTERGGRVFPQSDKAQDVLNALINYLKDGDVKTKTETSVKDVIFDNKNVQAVTLFDKTKIQADKYIISTGGIAHPETGSTGDGYSWLKKMGHTIITPRPALTPILVKQKWVRSLEGLSLKNVKINIYQENKRKLSGFGEALFTDNGLTGPIIISMSKDIGGLLDSGDVCLKIDFKPGLNFKQLDKRIQQDFKKNGSKMFKNSLNALLPSKLIPVIINLSGISPDKKTSSVTKEERQILLHLLKEFTFEVSGVAGFKRAMVTAGGVDLKEVNPQTMRSKIVNNLYFAGEILDIDGPSGGFNLQNCWSTGVLAGLLG